MSSVVTFGEVMLRLATQRRERFTQARDFEVTYGGGECNVAVSLAHFGIPATFVSCVPANAIGQSCINYVRQFGVDVSKIIRTGDRLGIYYLESGASMRSSKVISIGKKFFQRRIGFTLQELLPQFQKVPQQLVKRQ